MTEDLTPEVIARENIRDEFEACKDLFDDSSQVIPPSPPYPIADKCGETSEQIAEVFRCDSPS
jgi:hypothetical protein